MGDFALSSLRYTIFIKNAQNENEFIPPAFSRQDMAFLKKIAYLPKGINAISRKASARYNLKKIARFQIRTIVD